MHHKTKITFVDELGEPTELTLDKWVADQLFAKVGDLHRWVQSIYDKVVAGQMSIAKRVNALRRKTGESHRRAVGDFIRAYALMMISDGCDDF